MVDFKLSDFRRTREHIRPYVRQTPVVGTQWPDLYLKLENMQYTHSFKIRGAVSRVLNLVADGDLRTVLAVSAGNHGVAVARATTALGRSCKVVVPREAPRTKIDAILRYGIDLTLEGANYDEAEKYTLDLAQDRERYVFVSPYNDRDVILGQGTIALELIEELPELTHVIVPVGGGGIAAGIASAMKQFRPDVRIVGVQTEVSAAIYHSLKAGHIVTIPDRPTMADGIHGNLEAGSITFDLIRDYVDEVITVSENEILDALRILLYEEKTLAEGASAAAVAAFRSGKIVGTGPMVALITGGNIDPEEIVRSAIPAQTVG